MFIFRHKKTFFSFIFLLNFTTKSMNVVKNIKEKNNIKKLDQVKKDLHELQVNRCATVHDNISRDEWVKNFNIIAEKYRCLIDMLGYDQKQKDVFEQWCIKEKEEADHVFWRVSRKKIKDSGLISAKQAIIKKIEYIKTVDMCPEVWDIWQEEFGKAKQAYIVALEKMSVNEQEYKVSIEWSDTMFQIGLEKWKEFIEKRRYLE